MIPEGFRPTQQAVDVTGKFAIGVNEGNETLCLVTLKEEGIFRKKTLIDEYRIFRGRNILAVELIDVQSGTVITRTDRGSQLAGVVLGGALLGGVGALIGGLTAKTISQAGGVAYTRLKITVDDLKNPVYQFSLGGEKNLHWHGVMTILMQRSQRGVEASRPDVCELDEAGDSFDARKILGSRERNKKALERLHLEKIEREAQIKIAAEKKADLLRRKGVHHLEIEELLSNHDYSFREVLSGLSSLLAAGANPNGTGSGELEGIPYLQLALLGIEQYGDEAYEIVELLIRYGADVNCVSSFDGGTALEQCDENSFTPNKKIEELLLRSGAVPREARAKRGQSPEDENSKN